MLLLVYGNLVRIFKIFVLCASFFLLMVQKTEPKREIYLLSGPENVQQCVLYTPACSLYRRIAGN